MGQAFVSWARIQTPEPVGVVVPLVGTNARFSPGSFGFVGAKAYVSWVNIQLPGSTGGVSVALAGQAMTGATGALTPAQTGNVAIALTGAAMQAGTGNLVPKSDNAFAIGVLTPLVTPFVSGGGGDPGSPPGVWVRVSPTSTGWTDAN